MFTTKNTIRFLLLSVMGQSVTSADAARNDVGIPFGTEINGKTGFLPSGSRLTSDGGGHALDAVSRQLSSSTLNEIATLFVPNRTISDTFGRSVAASDDYIVVGYPNPLGIGAAYVFDSQTRNFLYELKPTDGAAGEMFGHSVALSGDVVVVGAVHDDDKGTGSGSAYVFSASKGGNEIHKLLATDGAPWDKFGWSVAVSGDVVVVGNVYDDVNGTNSGSAYIFSASKGGNEIHKLFPMDGAPWDKFGFSVAVSGDVVVVGAIYDDDKGTNSGSAYVFSASAGGVETHKLLPTDGAAGNGFGKTVAVYGDVVVVGAHKNDEGGSAYVFSASKGGNEIHKLFPMDGAARDEFGKSVAVYGDVVVVGAGKRAAFIFSAVDGAERYKLLPTNGAGPAGDEFGYSVAVSGDVVVVGSNKDSAYAFNVPTEAPTAAPTNAPTEAPTAAPTNAPTEAPTNAPTEAPTNAPTNPPTAAPTNAPTEAPTNAPTNAPTEAPTNAPTDAPTNAPTEAPTNAPTEAPLTDPGASGDPIIMGLNQQVFKFEGRDTAWYANVANEHLFWNMQFRQFDTCPLDENMFITGMSLSTFDYSDASHVLIVTTPEPIEECRVDPNAVCLGEGTLHISFDGGNTFVSQPGDYHYGSRGRVVAHNTYAACSRKWNDYGVSEQEGRNLREGGRRMTVVEKKPLALLSDKKMTMIDAEECGAWIDDRVNNNDLFQQKGHWSTLYIDTDVASFHIEYRRSDWFNRRCDFQSLDAWMTKVDGKMEKVEWNGILGETKKKIYDANTGEQVLSDRMILLRGNDDSDYEVDGPFGKIFTAGAGAGLGAMATSTS